MSKSKNKHHKNKLSPQKRARKRASRRAECHRHFIPSGCMLLNAANIYSLYGKVPEITRLFASELIQKLLYENGYEPKEYRKSLWQTMSFFILSLVFAALAGRASIAHMYFEYQNVCAMAGVRPASQRTVERSMEQAESISAAMEVLTNKFINVYKKLVDDLDGITIGEAISQVVKKLGNIDKIRLNDGCEFRIAREVNEGDCKGTVAAGRKIHASMSLESNSFDLLSIGGATSNEREAFVANTESQQGGCTLDLLDAGYNCDKVKRSINDRGDKFIIKGKNSSNPLVVKITRYEARADSMGNYKIVPGGSDVDLTSPTKLKELLKIRKVVPYEVINGIIVGYCYDLLLSDGFRLILIYNPNNKGFKTSNSASCWVFLDTSLSDVFDLLAVASLYRLRWQIEIMFLSHKSLGAIGSGPDSNRHTGDIFVYATMIAHLLKLYMAYKSTNDHLIRTAHKEVFSESCSESSPTGESANVMKVSMQKAAAHLGCPVYIWLLCVLNRADMVTEKTIYQQTEAISEAVASAVCYSRVSADIMASGKSIFATMKVLDQCIGHADTG